MEELKELSQNPTNISKEIWEFASKVFPLAWKQHGVVFGGFLRDLIAGVEPKDLDIDFKYEVKGRIKDQLSFYYASIFIEDLIKIYPILNEEEQTTSFSYSRPIKRIVVTINLGTEEEPRPFSLDLVTFGGENHPDFDVNELCLTSRKWNQLKNSFDQKLVFKNNWMRNAGRMKDVTIEQVVSFIHQRICHVVICDDDCCQSEHVQCNCPPRFLCDHVISTHRITKIKDKGYTIENEKDIIVYEPKEQ